MKKCLTIQYLQLKQELKHRDEKNTKKNVLKVLL